MSRHCVSTTNFAILFLFSLLVSSDFLQVKAGFVHFGNGANEFQMQFVTIGDPSNAPDPDPDAQPISPTLGRVDYEYGIGKFEVSEGMIDKYNAGYGTASGLMITKNERGENKPATGVSWNEAARFVNWLNTSTGGFAAYKFTTNGVNDDVDLWTIDDLEDYDATNPMRSKRATYVLPSYNEWYKAAYYDPAQGVYFDYPTGSNSPPLAVTSGRRRGTAVFGQVMEQGPADVNLAGGLSPYGVMGLGGNVYEWEESFYDPFESIENMSGASDRGFRGGDYNDNSSILSSSQRSQFPPSYEGSTTVGFRIVTLSPHATSTVPEPSTMVIGACLGVASLAATRRKCSKNRRVDAHLF